MSRARTCFGVWILGALGLGGCGDSGSSDAAGGSGANVGDGGSNGPGFMVGGGGEGANNNQGGNCLPNLVGTVRDAHPGGTAHTTGPAEFDQWYRDVADVNQAISFTITPVIDDTGLLTYDNMAFFPIDGQGFGDQGNEHNFHFTFELHMEFAYQGGEVFTFTGDDDLWVFINDRLAIDLGGLHPSQSETIDLDARAAELGIVPGTSYPLDLFHAERHTNASNFRVQTSLSFTNCDPIIY